MCTPTTAPKWTFAGADDEARLAALATPFALSDLVHQLRRKSTLVCFHRQPRTADPTFSRAVFCVVVGADLFDRFFNSASGYRGAYFISPEEGTAANRILLDSLAPEFLQFAIGQDPKVDQAWLICSLSKPSAKCWLAEETLHLCSSCVGEWSASYQPKVRIDNSRWEGWGGQAPRLTKIRYFGAFVNGANEEWVADHKHGRARQIWGHGWS